MPLYKHITPLYPHQEIMLEWLGSRDSGILGTPMGSGKTLVCFRKHLLSLEEAHDDAFLPKKTLFVAPKAVAPQVYNQYYQHLHAPRGSCVLHLGSERNNARNLAAFNNARFVVTTYDMLIQDLKEQKAGRNAPLFEVVWEMMFMDEAHIIRNQSTIKYEACMKLQTSEDCEKFCISGTPVQNKESDMIALCNFLEKPPYNRQSWWNTASEQQVANWRSEMYLYISKEQCAPLPTKTYYDNPVALIPEQALIYKAIKDRASDLVNDYFSGTVSVKFAFVLAVIMRLKQTAIHPDIMQDAPSTEGPVSDSGKFIEARRIIKETPPGDKIIVFSQFTKALSLFGRYLAQDGISSLTFTGDLSSSVRESVLHKFKTETPAKSKVLLISIQAGGVGLDITTANHVIMLEPWWNCALEAQAIDRTHRIGQKKPVHVHRIKSTNTLEDWIFMLQRKKQAIASDLLHAIKEAGPSAEDLRMLYDTHLQAPDTEETEEELEPELVPEAPAPAPETQKRRFIIKIGGNQGSPLPPPCGSSV